MKKELLITYNFILHYRKPVFNLLCQRYNVTVLHSGEVTVGQQDTYKEIIVPVKKIGPFYIQKGILPEVKKDYDVIIALFDVRWLYTLLSIYFHNPKSKFILWGAWITDSFWANKARLYLTNKVDSNVFYTHEARRDFIERGIDESQLYVANNTFDVGERIKSYENALKDKILFVGSLDKRKQNDLLINAFYNIIDKIPQNINLTIIGDGVESENLKNTVSKHNLKDRVIFVGKVNDTNILKNYYKESIVSVSFGQAGLSVLQSLGYGVPFLTKHNAISGGEKTNIKNNINSIFCEDNIESLEKQLVYLCNNIVDARKLGENAYNYYSEFCTIENMAQGFIDAIENTRYAKVDIN